MTVRRLESLMRVVDNDHGGTGALHVYRAYDRMREPSAIAFIDVVAIPPGSSIGLHQHGDDEETYVVMRGKGEMTVDGAVFSVGAGDVIRNRPYGHHGLINCGDEDLQLLVFETAPAQGADGSVS